MKDGKFNVGLDLLRIWLSFEVVCAHFWSANLGVLSAGTLTNFIKAMTQLAVPCFMVMTFFLTARRFTTVDGTWVKKRFHRLLVPFLFWPVVYLAVGYFCGVYSETYRAVAGGTSFVAPSWTDLLWQWAFGSSPHLSMQLWFQADLIILTAVFYVLYRFVASHLMAYVLVGLTLVAFTFQYSPLNLFVFGDLPYEMKWTLGRLCAMIPLAAVGFAYCLHKEAVDKLSRGVKCAITVAAVWIFLLFYNYNICPTPKGLLYQGLRLVVEAMAVVAFFYLLPLRRFPARAVSAVQGISRYCMGIYCCHLLLGRVLYAYVFPHIGVGYRTPVSCLVIWGCSWALCRLIALLPNRFFKDVVS